jgi:hypothetical protein
MPPTAFVHTKAVGVFLGLRLESFQNQHQNILEQAGDIRAHDE